MADEAILIVEDDAAMLRGLKDNFALKGYKVLTAADGEAGYEAALTSRPDLIVLDIMIPRINGYELCRLLRAEGLDCPIIMLTAKGEESDIVLGLNIGADDYMTKPFSIRELLARAAAMLRRRRSGEPRQIAFGDFLLDMDARRLTAGGRPIELTPKELALLALLAGQPGRVFTRDEILRRVWGRSVIVSGRSVDRCIATLRAKIEPDPRRPAFIRTIREAGYRFK
jgi:DNA-binding response OmpR family regulator